MIRSTKHIVLNSFFDTWQKEPYFQSSFPRHFLMCNVYEFSLTKQILRISGYFQPSIFTRFFKMSKFLIFPTYKRYCRPLYDISDHYVRILPTIKRYCRPSKDISNRIRKKNSLRRRKNQWSLQKDEKLFGLQENKWSK